VRDKVPTRLAQPKLGRFSLQQAGTQGVIGPMEISNTELRHYQWSARSGPHCGVRLMLRSGCIDITL
jgi:hypothetical protein